MGYDSKDLYDRWTVARTTITDLRARVENITAALRDKSKEVLQYYERKLLCSEITAKKLGEHALEVSKLKVEKSALG